MTQDPQRPSPTPVPPTPVPPTSVPPTSALAAGHPGVALLVLLLAPLLALGLLAARQQWQGQAARAEASAAAMARLVGHTVVVVGQRTGIEVNPGLPVFTGQYTVELPATPQGAAARTKTYPGAQDRGFKRREEANLPQSYEFEVDLRNDTVVQSGPVGTVTPTTTQVVEARRQDARNAELAATFATFAVPVLLAAAGVALVLLLRSRRIRR